MCVHEFSALLCIPILLCNRLPAVPILLYNRLPAGILLNTLSRIPAGVGQTCEENVNKDTETPGGTKVFSLKPGAVSKHNRIAGVSRHIHEIV